MSKIRSSSWWKYFVSLLLGSLIFVSLIPSCTTRSSSHVFTPVKENKAQESQELIFSQTKSLAEIVANLPTAAEIRAMPLAPHPRLLASEERFAEIKEQIKTDEVMREWHKKLLEKAEVFIRDDDLPEYEVLKTRRLLATSQRVQRQVSIFALLYRLEHDQRYLDKVWQELSTAAKFPDWNPSKFLDTAEMTVAFAIGYDWLYPYWNETQKSIIRNAIIDKSLKPALEDYSNNEWWTTIEHNWNQVCNGGIILGSLAVIDKQPETASQSLYESLQRLPKAMQHYAPDGAWSEGISYWHFGTLNNTLALSALSTAFNTDFDLAKIFGFAQTGWFPIYMTGAFGLTFNFGDAKDYRIRAPELLWLANKFNIQAYADYQKIFAAPEAIDLIWYRPKLNTQFSQNVSLNKHFGGVDVVTMRNKWNDPAGVFVGFKAGDNQASHGNLDIGTFVLDALNVRWAIDLGRENYNIPGYFDLEDKRWDFYRVRSEGQNTLVIDPDQEPGQKLKAKGTITYFSDNPLNPSVVADLTPAYNSKVSRLSRAMSITEKKQIVIQDKIEAKELVDILWFMHTQAEIEIARDGKTAMLYQDGVRLFAQILTPIQDYEFRIEAAQPLASSPQVQGQDHNTGIKKLTVSIKQVSKAKITIVFTPLKESQSIPRQLPRISYFDD
jgi:Heparinase II/III-like protein